MHIVHRNAALRAEWLVIKEVKEAAVTDDEEITQLQIRNSNWHKSISSTCFSVGAGEKPCSRRDLHGRLKKRVSVAAREGRWEMPVALSKQRMRKSAPFAYFNMKNSRHRKMK
ncbi:uncharacterized protein M6G45_001698 [Spheniscus humboldti]